MRVFTACLIVAAALAAPAAAHAAGSDLTVRGVRYFSYPDFTRVVFEIEAAAPYVLNKTDDGRGLVFSAYEGRFSVAASLPVINDGVVGFLELKQDAAKPYVLVPLGPSAGEVRDFVLRSPDRIVLDIARKGVAAPAPPPAAPQALQPALPKRVIVLDPGHGGRDSGTVSAQGHEKTRSLELARAIKNELKKMLPDARVVLTRDRDHAVTLAGRAAASNAAGAALFISLHFAAGRDVQVYILGLGQDGVAGSRLEPRDFLGVEAAAGLRETLWGSQQYAHAAGSSSLGRTLMQHLTGRPDSAPAQAQLALLRAVDAPAVLVEVGFERNRVQTAEAIARGVEAYVRKTR